MKIKNIPQLNIRPQENSIIYRGWLGGLNNTNNAFSIKRDEISDGQNVEIDESPSVKKRRGATRYGPVISFDGAIKGLIPFQNDAGTRRLLAIVKDGSTLGVYHDNGDGSSWTKFTNTFSTTTNNIEGVIRTDNDKVYLTNGADDIISWDGSSEATISSAFLKGKILSYWYNRLWSTNQASNTNRVTFTDEYVETQQSNGFVIPDGPIGDEPIITAFNYNSYLYVGNNKGVALIARPVVIDATVGLNPEYIRVITGVRYGPVSHRTVQIVDGFVYWLGSDGHIYRFDGSNAVNISKSKILGTRDDLNLNQLTGACAASFSNKYFLAVPVSGAITNKRIIVYDAVKDIFYPWWITPYSISAFAVYKNSSGQEELFAGDGDYGAVYKLETTRYDDEYGDQQQLTGNDTDLALDANPVKRVAQSFQLSETDYITGVTVIMKKNAGTLTGITCRIETDSSSLPSGTLLDANLTTTTAVTSPVDLTTSYVASTFTFSTPAEGTLDTTYWLVLQHTTEGAGNSQYYVAADGSSPAYADGNVATYASGAWTADTAKDLLFVIHTRRKIDGYFDTKADDLNEPQLKKIFRKVFCLFRSGSTDILLGYTDHAINPLETQTIDTATGSTQWDVTGPWDSSTLSWDSGATQVEKFVSIAGKRARYIRMRFRNNRAENFTIYRAMINYKKLPQLTN